MDYIPIKTNLKKLPKGMFIKYYKIDGGSSTGFVKSHWKKGESQGIAFENLKNTESPRYKSWTVSYNNIAKVEKKVDPRFKEEFEYLINLIKKNKS